MRAWDAPRIARAAGAALACPPPGDAGPRARGDRLARGRLRGPVRGPPGRQRRRRSVRVRGAGGRGLGRPDQPRARRRGAPPAAWLTAARPARRAAAARRGVAARARRRRDRRDRLHRQDLDQGSAARGARAAPPHDRLPRRTSTPRSACRSRSSVPRRAPRSWCSRWRCAGSVRSPSWPAIAEPDVGVIVSVGPGPPRAAGHDRGDRRGQGGADRRPGAGRDCGRPGRRAAARSAPAR